LAMVEGYIGTRFQEKPSRRKNSLYKSKRRITESLVRIWMTSALAIYRSINATRDCLHDHSHDHPTSYQTSDGEDSNTDDKLAAASSMSTLTSTSASGKGWMKGSGSSRTPDCCSWCWCVWTMRWTGGTAAVDQKGGSSGIVRRRCPYRRRHRRCTRRGYGWVDRLGP
jgi:hypothetical protein